MSYFIKHIQMQNSDLNDTKKKMGEPNWLAFRYSTTTLIMQMLIALQQEGIE